MPIEAKKIGMAKKEKMILNKNKAVLDKNEKVLNKDKIVQNKEKIMIYKDEIVLNKDKIVQQEDKIVQQQMVFEAENNDLLIEQERVYPFNVRSYLYLDIYVQICKYTLDAVICINSCKY